jgi:carbon-monoxide dehydrogenase large subunit
MQRVTAPTLPDTPDAPPPWRREDDALLRGQGCYVHDVHLPDALHLVFARSAHAHATVLALHLDDALAEPGVVAVFGGAALGLHTLPAINPLLPLLEADAFPLLAHHTLAYVGQPLAVVVARSAEAAGRAAARVRVDVQEHTPRQDFEPGSVAVRAMHAGGTTPAAPRHRVQTRLECPRVLAMAMEPRACCAQWHSDAAALTVWLGTQTPSRARDDIAATLGLPTTQVRVISPDVGGAFGSRASVCPEDLLVALTARHLGATVRWASSRSEDFVAGMHGRGARLDGELVLGEDGRFLALSARLAFTLGAWLPFSAVVPLRNAARILPGPYRVDAIDVQGTATRSHAAPVNIYRGAGRPEAALLMETLVDLAARRSGIDPVELRRRNLVAASDMPWPTASGETLDSGNYPEALQRACARFGYEAARLQQQHRREAGELVGIGVAMYIEPCGQGWESARVTLHQDGRATVASGSPAQGQGHATTFAQIAADALGCAPGQVTVLMGDTATCPAGTGALASRSTAIGGSAVVQACREARSRQQSGQALPRVVDTRFTAREAWSYGCVITQMAVDPDTCEPTVERVVWVDDAGQIISPMLARGQLLGGAAQGLGQALLERMVYDSAGQPITGSLMDYAVPRASDMPDIEIESMHIPSPHNLLGAKGVGEAGCIGVPAALMNAARDALHSFGEPDLQFPLTAEQLWRAMTFPHDSHTHEIHKI